MNSHRSSTKVIVGMSGGVDSSVAAWLLKEQGYAVEGLFMKNWEEDDGTEYCTAIEDLKDARQVCEKIGIRLHEANFAGDYWDNVFEHFLAEYRAHRTPNPDILCNKEIKFKVFLEYAEMLGAEFIATGHYACLDHQGGRTALKKGLDISKDQSYFLHAVDEGAFARTLFPVGALEKSEVREIAQTQDFVTHDKKDSTGICFIGERKFRDFLETYIPARPGPIKTRDGIELGEHQGLMFYTYGQRQGLHIGGVKGTSEAAWYVIDKEVSSNALIVGQGTEHPDLYSQGLRTRDLHFINGMTSATEFTCNAKTRYRQPDQTCRVMKQPEGWEILFDEKQRAITPGQSVVLYNADICLGGGIIDTVIQ